MRFDVMSFFTGGGAQRPLGIDLGSSRIKAVQVKGRGRGARVAAVYTAEVPREKPERPPLDLLTAALKSLLEENRISTDRMVSSFPLLSAIIRNTVVPFRGRSKIRQVIKFQAEPHIPFPIEEVVIDFLETAAPEEDKTPVVIVGAKKDRISRHLEIFRGAGLDPEIIGVDAIALAGNYLARADTPPPEELAAILDIGATKTLLVLVRGRSLMLARSIPVGGDDLTEAVQQEFSLGFAAAEKMKCEKGAASPGEGAAEDAKRMHGVLSPVLARLTGEVDRSLRALSAGLKGAAVARLYLSGGGALLNGMREHCAREFNCPAEYLAALSPFEGSGGEDVMSCAAVATGLALQGLGGGGMEIDLRREELAYTGSRRKARRQLIVTAALALALAAVSGFAFTRSLIASRTEHAELSRQLAQVYAETFPGEKTVAPAEIGRRMEAKYAEYLKIHQSFSALSAEALSSLDILREASSLIPGNLKTQITSLVIGQDRVEMEGLVNSPGDADAIKQALKRSAHLQEVEVPSTSAYGPDKHKFRLVAEIRKIDAAATPRAPREMERPRDRRNTP